MSSDYKKSGFDEGHLANAEDFANNCPYEESTFRFWNAMPQTPLLNRGIWKVQETEIRKKSQSQALIVLCGGIYNGKTIGNGVSLPDTCWKIVIPSPFNSPASIYYQAAIFTNTDHPVRTDWPIEKLESYLKKRYNLDIEKLVNEVK